MAHKTFAWRKFPVRRLWLGEVRLRSLWCGICGTDLHEYDVGPIVIPTQPPAIACV